MRLIDTKALTLHERFGEVIPLYGILSYRWEDDEVTFQDFRDNKGPKLRGWKKITGCCAIFILVQIEFVGYPTEN
jgi:hypothetical protein